MTLGVRIACVAGLALCAVASGAAQGKKNQGPSKWPGTAEFRSNVAGTYVGTDRVHGDGTNYALTSDGDGTAGAGLYRSGSAGYGGSSTMHINLGNPSVYEVTLQFFDLERQDAGYSAFPYHGQEITVVTGMEIQNAVADENGEEVQHALLSVPVGASAPSRLRFSFKDPNGSGIQWHLKFFSLDYDGATELTVTRTAQCTWVFEADEDDRAGLWGYGAFPGQRKATRKDVALYRMPLRITFNAFDAPECQ